MLKLDGKPLSLQRPRPALAKLKKFLNSSGADDLFTAGALEAKCGVSAQSLAATMYRDPELAAFTFLAGHKRYWGNPKAIAELRRLAK